MARDDVYANVIQCKDCGASKYLEETTCRVVVPSLDLDDNYGLYLLDHDGTMEGIDMAAHPTAHRLAARSLEFLKEVKD